MHEKSKNTSSGGLYDGLVHHKKSKTGFIVSMRPPEISRDADALVNSPEELLECCCAKPGFFRVVWPFPEAVNTEMGDLYATIAAAMRSKANRQFLSPRQFMRNRKKEGATESRTHSVLDCSRSSLRRNVSILQMFPS